MTPEMSEPDRWAEEMAKAGAILRQNRHSTLAPYKWYGPDAEPNPPGADCACLGCEAAKHIRESG